jgi:superfamily II RNA helicase
VVLLRVGLNFPGTACLFYCDDVNVSHPLPEFNQLFPFQLDAFQQEAIAALEADHSIVVCAPTGSGKTLIGEYAIYRALTRQRRVLYTTPLKALSNQKLRDFRERFGTEQVGLLTGDVSINREAPILVMTTEIFRNMLYGTPIGEVGTSLTGVEVVVLDECHYMNDRQRGTVWEESIIYCPPEIQLVALSATVANGDQLTDWIDRVHGSTRLIYSDWRPVPLQFHFCHPKGLFPLLNSEGNRMNPRLVPKGGSRDQRRGKSRQERRADSPSLGFVVSQLQQRDMLPAIYFIFSRRGCDLAVKDIGDISLLTPQESDRLKLALDQFLHTHPEVGRADYLEPLYRGIAAHHAGILPPWKAVVEELFQQGLIKLVFATETLAAGINMPARTTVISSLSKRTDSGHRLLTASEFLQMAGRAGRRGMDLEGHVVTVQSPFEGAREAAYLGTARPDPLISQFTPGYGMVLNLLQTHTLEQAKDLVERSFGQYLATLDLAPQQQAIADLVAELTQTQTRLAGIDLPALENHQKLREQLREEQRLLKTLRQQAAETQHQSLVLTLLHAAPGTLLSLQSRSPQRHPLATPPDGLTAVLVKHLPGSGQFPHLVCLGRDNRWCIVSPDHVLEMHGPWAEESQLAGLQLPLEMSLKLGQSHRGDEISGAIAQKIPHCALTPAPEVVAQSQRLAALESKLADHPAQQWPNPAGLLRLQRRSQDLELQIEDRQRKLQQQSHRHWQEFLRLIEILQSFGGLEQLIPTALGKTAAALRGDNELWLGLAVSSGRLDELSPHHLAAACAALVTEPPRSDSWTAYLPPEDVETALAELRSLRRQLFQMQRRQQIILPIWLELDLVGLVEQWALGVEWTELCANTNLDEGDIVRLMRRTLDFLSQLPHAPHVPSELRQNAIRAGHLLDRFPVNETL